MEPVKMDIHPVDVICVCSADGQLRPLRLQLEDGGHRLYRLDIQEVVGVREVRYVGVEALIFLCRAFEGERERVFELRYTLRAHTWQLLRWVS